MKETIRMQLAKRKRKIRRRLEGRCPQAPLPIYGEPVLNPRRTRYDVHERCHGIHCGGVPALLHLARRTGRIHGIHQRLRLFKFYLPYTEADHVLNLAANALGGGTCLEHIERRRHDASCLEVEALGAERIPDPTTAGPR